MKTNLSILLALFFVASCTSNPEVTVENEGFAASLDQIFNDDIEDKIAALAQEDFSVDVGPFRDNRTASSFVADPENSVIYEYQVDKLLQNTAMYLQHGLQRNMQFGPRKQQVYVVEGSITKTNIAIRSGSFFTGHWGRYVIAIDTEIVVRNPDSSIVTRTPVSIKHEMSRHSQNGRNPTADQDRSRILKVLDQAVRDMAVQIAWKVRRAHLRKNIDVLVEDSFGS